MYKLMTHTFYSGCDVERQISEFIKSSDQLSMGEVTFEFEKQFAKWHQRKFCTMFNSGSSANLALFASLINLKVLSGGDKVGISGVTWSTNVMPLIQLGLEPVLLDIDKDNLNLCSSELEKEIKNLKAVFVTNLLGLNNQLINISRICNDNNVLLFEDNCEALGCEINQKKYGNFGEASTCSSYVGHHFSTIEGGYVFTDNKKLHAMLKLVRAHGWARNLDDEEKDLLGIKETDKFHASYTFWFPGFNLRPSEINSYAGLIQLPKLDFYNSIRKSRFKELSELFTDRIYSSDSSNPIFAIPIKSQNTVERDKLVSCLDKLKIENRPIVSGSIGNQPFWKNEFSKTSLVNASLVDGNGLYISNDPQIEDTDFELLKTTLGKIL